jgi:beta-N-acetylglucosaminidase
MDFRALMLSRGFPESYLQGLEALHLQYPLWDFTPYTTNLDWDTVIASESVVGENLLPNSKGIEWKSTEEGAYNWKTDTFIAHDGASWVTASVDAVKYYMDPRNFLDEHNVFQFELLQYRPEYQNAAGVENILLNTAMSNKTYTYKDDAGKTVTISYAQTFVEAALYSNVSPYHLASRVKQEVVVGKDAFSNSATGTVAGYENLFNFYNIGAYNSTVAGGAIINGMKYAKNGTTNATMNASSLIPWNNRYRSIVGGAYIIGNTYIGRGQDTIYLQKFNVTPTSTYNHQYMSNVEAPYEEGRKVYMAYGDIVSALPIAFSIPVYLNMPQTPCSAPLPAKNPNNILKSLTVADLSGTAYELAPVFAVAKDEAFTLTVNNNVEVVNVQAEAVSKKAGLVGADYYTLSVGDNTITVTVTAENGDKRNYTIVVSRRKS